MKKAFYTFAVIVLSLFSCEDDDENLFEKTADERAAEAVANLKQELIAPGNGWIIRYTPQEGSGSYYVLLDFQENDKVIIRSDLGAEEGAYFENTIGYRIDNSLGLELIFENYSFFSFLFEQDQATFGAEYEFDFVNKTPDNALVFRSKTDVSTPDIIVFEEASADDVNLLGMDLGANLNILSSDLDKFTSSLKLTYANRDVALYVSLDELRRTVTFTSASLKSNTSTVQNIGYTTPFIIEGDSIIFDAPLQGTILGNAINIRSIKLDAIGELTLSVCATPITIHTFPGKTSTGESITLETTLLDVSGQTFAQASDFYFSPLFIFNNGVQMSEEIQQNITGALEVDMYYGFDRGGGQLLYGIGFYMENQGGTATLALREFTPVLDNNRITFNFADDITLFGDQTPDANIENINIYLNALTEGNNTFVFQLNENLYEFYNPCTGWSFVFIKPNQ